MKRRVVDRRIRFLLAVLAVAFAATFGRAVWLQAVRAEPLARMAQSQHRATVAIPASRGTIYDRNGVQLAIGEHATTIYADPRQIRDPERVAQFAARALRLDPRRLAERLAARKRGFVYVARQADPRRAAALARRGIDGLGFYAEERRAYPQRSIAAHVLGYAGIDNRGIAGLEWSLDKILAGKPGSQTFVKDPVGRAIEVVQTTPEREGRDVYLTLDHNLQATAESVLRATVRRWGAKAASAVVLDPRDGAVLAMAVAPGFDANRFGAAPTWLTRNRAVTDTYEPGSTFKLITVAGVLSERIAEPDTTYVLPPSIRVADRVINEAHSRGTEQMSVADILSRSSNVGTITLALALGKERVAKWIGRFGFGRPTGIDFPGETAGIVLPPKRWSGSTIGNVPIGHGIAVTPVQMATAYAVVANGGMLVQPHLVRRIGGGKRVVPKTRRILSPGVARTMAAMLEGVVDDAAGTGAEAAVPGYHVAGKTGTAAKPDERGGYSQSRYVASFVGFVPVTKPRLVILVTVDEPRGAIWGGVVAAPAFQQIARFGLQYLEIPPDSAAP